MKHSWLLAVIVFAGALALGNLVGAPLYCRGEFAIPLLDRAAVCAGQTGLTRSASMLFYFAAVGLALFIGIVADKLPRRAPKEEPKKEEKPAEPVEPAAVVTPTPSVAAVAVAEAPQADAPKAETAAPAETSPEPVASPTPEVPAKVDLASIVEQALKGPVTLPVTAAPAPAPAPSVAPPAPTPLAEVPKMPPAPVLPPPPKPAPIAKPWKQSNTFEGTNEELIARFKELGKMGGVEAIATAQRNLDESTLAALGGGVDPKQHLSQIAHLLLIDDPELKSEVARGVVVHIAARLKELGVVANLQAGGASA